MKLIHICPQCGNPGIKVNAKAILYNLKKPEEIKSDKRWASCVNPGCDCSYFSQNFIFSVTDLVKPLFYKDKSGIVPICYCSGLTRGEINSAVKKGCKTIRDIKKYTGKSTSGHCNERNPLGKCCREVFQMTIKTAINKKPVRNTNKIL